MVNNFYLLMIIYGHKELEEVMKIEDNTVCFDCLVNKSTWASINNAIFLCSRCCVEHRSLGNKISLVRSLTLDLWKDEQAALVKIGGNKRLRGLLQLYDIDIANVGKKVLYNSRLVDFYRKLIHLELYSMKHDLFPPKKEEALKSLTVEVNYNTIGFSSFKFNGQNKKLQLEPKDPLSTVEPDIVESGFISSFNSWISGNLVVNSIVSAPKNITKTIINETAGMVSSATNTIFDKAVDLLVS